MPRVSRPVYIATRGSALALAQARQVQAECRAHFPELRFELKIIKTTGDKMQTASLAQLTHPGNSSEAEQALPKGLFTKDLEIALLQGEADFAVHSLKDLPTELPEGLRLAAAGEREDARDVLIFRHESTGGGEKRGFAAGTGLAGLPAGALIATSSTRRQAQITARRPDLKTAAIRGNVGTRLHKLHDQAALDAIILAHAGLNRLGFLIGADGMLAGEGVPAGLAATVLSMEEMLPCVGQAAIGIEGRAEDAEMARICARLNHAPTLACVTAERAFLRAMGGGCLSPVAAYAEIEGNDLRLRAVSFRDGPGRRTERRGPAENAEVLGRKAAEDLR